MKKRLLIGGVVAILASAIATAALAASPIKLVVNGREIQPDVPPQLVNGRTMVPVRWVAEALGADVEWDPANSRVTVVTPAWEAEASGAQAELELLRSELRVAASPRELVEKYAQALKTRNGALVRAYLAPAIREHVPAGVIGVSAPVTTVEIEDGEPLPGDGRRFTLRAFFGPYGDNPPSLAFAEAVSVVGEGQGRYMIIDVVLLEDNTKGAFWKHLQEADPAAAALQAGRRRRCAASDGV